MYVLVHHRVTDPQQFWPLAEEAVSNIPAHLELVHTFPSKDGVVATCIWEAESQEAVRRFLEPLLGDVSDNEYMEGENREGIALPTQVQPASPLPVDALADQPPAEA